MNRNRTQEEIDFDITSFENGVIELRKDWHDNCDMNSCTNCKSNVLMQDVKNIALELDHAIKHKVVLVHFRER